MKPPHPSADGASPRERSGTDVEHAAAVLRHGGVVGVPTETVYGLAASLESAIGIAKVFSTKGRPTDHPLIAHVTDVESARALASTWPATAETLAREFWPGPLTIVVPAASHVPLAATGGRTTVAVRVPSHPLFRRLLATLDLAVVAPSANRFGEVSPTTADHVLADLGDAVDYVLDGGPCAIGLESTIVDCATDPPQILRPGAVTAEMLAEVLETADATGPSRAPGMLEKHYAPRCRLVLVETNETPRPGVRILDASADPVGFARRLYDELRRLDDEGVETAQVILPSDRGIGRAIRDRLGKAAAGR